MDNQFDPTSFTVQFQPELALDLLSPWRLHAPQGSIRKALQQAGSEDAELTPVPFARRTDLIMMGLAAAGYVTYTYNGLLPRYAITESGTRLLIGDLKGWTYTATPATVTIQPGIMDDWMRPSRFGNANGQDIKFVLNKIATSPDGYCYFNHLMKVIAVALAVTGYIILSYEGAGGLVRCSLTDAGQNLLTLI